MKPEQSDLPSEFEYLRQALDLCTDTSMLISTRRDSALNCFSSNQLSMLADAYREIIKRDDMLALSDWRSSYPLPNRNQSRAGDFFRLIHVFRYYHEHEVPPFSDRLLQIEYPKRIPNWDNLPEELMFLREPAEKYGIYQFDDERADFVESMTDDQREELRAVYKRLEDKHVAELFDAWCKAYEITDHEEAALVYFMFGVMDYADL